MNRIGLLFINSPQRVSKFVTDLSNFQISPFGPRPNFGGSMMIPSYFLPRLISLLINLNASSTIHRTGLFARLDKEKDFLPTSITLRDASMCVTNAPARAANREAMPVYPKRFRISGFLFDAFIFFSIQRQFSICSGNIPICRDLEIFRATCRPSMLIDHEGFFLVRKVHDPVFPPLERVNSASAESQTLFLRDGFQVASGSKRMR